MVVPAFNEAENLVETIPQAIEVLEGMHVDYEVLVIDDGSTDATAKVMRQLSKCHPHLRYIRLRRNSGKTAALSIGFDLSKNDLIVMMDADGQDEPREIPALVAKLDEGFDLVTGRRATRQDRFLKRHTSQLYNATTAWVSGVPGRDFNSGLKVLRREVAETVDIYGELHRYLPVLAAWSGFAVTEVEVEHHPRLYGKTKYGIARFWRGFFDLGTVKFITSYNRRPFHLFGGAGLFRPSWEPHCSCGCSSDTSWAFPWETIPPSSPAYSSKSWPSNSYRSASSQSCSSISSPSANGHKPAVPTEFSPESDIP